jgi:hypothetical protein
LLNFSLSAAKRSKQQPGAGARSSSTYFLLDTRHIDKGHFHWRKRHHKLFAHLSDTNQSQITFVCLTWSIANITMASQTPVPGAAPPGSYTGQAATPPTPAPAATGTTAQASTSGAMSNQNLNQIVGHLCSALVFSLSTSLLVFCCIFQVA